MKIRLYVVNKLMDVLRESFCGIENFDVQWPSKGQHFLKISFIPNTNYFLNLGSGGSGNSSLYTETCPGFLLNREIDGGLHIDDVYLSIKHWTERVQQEIRSPQYEESLDDFITDFRKKIDDNISDKNSMFDSSEVSDLISRLDALDKKFDELHKRAELNSEELKKLKSSTKVAADDLPVYTKGVWYKLHLSKIYTLMKNFAKTKEGREAISSTFKKLLEYLN